MNNYADLTDEQINAQIAERLFGYEKHSEVFGNYPYATTYEASIGLVVPAMRERGWMFFLTDMSTHIQVVFEQDDDTYFDVRSDYGKEPRAICEAALLALDSQEAQG